MNYRFLGTTGVRVAPIALGTDNFANPTSSSESRKMLLRAIDAGINLIDTSDSYAKGDAERIIGRTLAQTKLRDHVLIATKVYYPSGAGPNDRGNSRLHIMNACHESLKRLKTDRVDLYQLHRPDFEVPVEETLGALTDLVRQGKVRYVGSSTAPAWKVAEAVFVSELKGYVRFTSEQSPYNLLDRRIENELIPACQAFGIGLLAWSPLAMGLLTGRYSNARKFPTGSRANLRGGIYAERVTARGIEAGRQFTRLAKHFGISPARLALLWAKDQPGVTSALIGPRTLQQLNDLLPVINMSLTDDVAHACDALVPPGSAISNFHNSSGWMKMHLLE